MFFVESLILGYSLVAVMRRMDCMRGCRRVPSFSRGLMLWSGSGFCGNFNALLNSELESIAEVTNS